jgi:hypothetical protein
VLTISAMKPLIRKTRQPWSEPGHAHFLTYSCYRRLPLLTRDRVRRVPCRRLFASTWVPRRPGLPSFAQRRTGARFP